MNVLLIDAILGTSVQRTRRPRRKFIYGNWKGTISRPLEIQFSFLEMLIGNISYILWCQIYFFEINP